MKQILGKSVLTLLVCFLAFGVAYATARQVSGEEGTTEGTPTVAADETPLPDSTIVPVDTPSARRPFNSIEDLGELAPAGSVFEKWGVRLQIPSGLGDFRVIYPVIVDGPGVEDWESNVIMTVYNTQTHSSLFLGFELTERGARRRPALPPHRDLARPPLAPRLMRTVGSRLASAAPLPRLLPPDPK